MKKIPRKILFCAGGLVVYAAAVAFVAFLLYRQAESHPLGFANNPSTNGHELEQLSPLFASAAKEGASAALIPLGPDDSRLPGSSALWDAFLRGEGQGPAVEPAGEFSLIQGVTHTLEFSRSQIDELFLSGSPQQIFRQGKHLLVLNDNGIVQVIDCKHPEHPQRIGSLPYERVARMAIQGDLAYLLIKRPPAEQDALVVANISKPLEPREIARQHLPKGAETFYLKGRRLVVQTAARNEREDGMVTLYDVTENHRFITRGSARSAMLMNDFLPYDDFMLASDSRAGVHVYDVRNPLRSTIVASLDFPAKVKQFARHGEMVFAVGNNEKIYVIDMHNPRRPVLTRTVERAVHSAAVIEYDDYTYYFTTTGYLKVFDMHAVPTMNKADKHSDTCAEELVALPQGEGFSLLCNHRRALEEGVTGLYPLPGVVKAVATAQWQDGVAVLDVQGGVSYFRKSGNSPAPSWDRIQLPSGQRWIAVDGERLYVGGGSTVSVLVGGQQGVLTLEGQYAVPAAESYDGIVVGRRLYLAAGRNGLLTFSLDRPDEPVTACPWDVPFHIEPRFEVRSLASPGGNRLLVAAGPAGLLDGRVDAQGAFRMSAVLNLGAQAEAVEVINQMSLVMAEGKVCVVNMKDAGRLQNLGCLSFSGITRLAVDPPGYWAGYVPGEGWSVLNAPRILEPSDSERIKFAHADLRHPLVHLYRLKFFNDHGVATVPGAVRYSPLVMEESGEGGS